MTDTPHTPAAAGPEAAGPAASRYQVITRQRHGTWRWHRPPHYGAAARMAMVPLAGFEVSLASVRLPLAFVQQNGRFALVAVLGIPPALNLCVAPDGQWVGPYTPAVLRAAPFALRRTPEGQQLLCIDETAAQAGPAEEMSGGELFFTPEGTPAPLISQVMGFLTQLDQGTRSMEAACAALHAQGLIVPWDIAFNTEPGGPSKPAQGLWRVDEVALLKLGADALHGLLQQGALALAYGQMFSMHNVGLLADWARARQKPARPSTAAAPATQAVPPTTLPAAQAANAPAPAAQAPALEPASPVLGLGESDTIRFNW